MDGKISHEALKRQLTFKSQQQYESEWIADIGSSSKLIFYSEIKNAFEKNLDSIDNIHIKVGSQDPIFFSGIVSSQRNVDSRVQIWVKIVFENRIV